MTPSFPDGIRVNFVVLIEMRLLVVFLVVTVSVLLWFILTPVNKDYPLPKGNLPIFDKAAEDLSTVCLFHLINQFLSFKISLKFSSLDDFLDHLHQQLKFLKMHPHSKSIFKANIGNIFLSPIQILFSHLPCTM